MKPKNQAEEASLREALVGLTVTGFGFDISDPSIPFVTKPRDEQSQLELSAVLEKAERFRSEYQMDASTLYELGVGWRNYTGWYERGDDREPGLRKAVDAFEEAFYRSAEDLPIRITDQDLLPGYSLDQVTIAGDLGLLLVEERLVRDLDDAEQVLSFLWDQTLFFDPFLISLVEIYMRKNDYELAAEKSIELCERASVDPEWSDSPPPALTQITVTACRKIGKLAKADGDSEEALRWFEQIEKLDATTEMDERIISKLREE